MQLKRCLYCYNDLKSDEIDFHPACSRKIFGSSVPPELPYTEEQMLQLGLEVVKSQIAVPGVQPAAVGWGVVGWGVVGYVLIASVWLG